MVLVILFALSLAGTGILFGQNPLAPDAPVLLEKNNPVIGTETPDPSRGPASLSAEPPPLYYTEGIHVFPRLGYENT
ncbi:MAG: hypothetical protein ABI041_00165, partial [Bdellovibrionia bacterium]